MTTLPKHPVKVIIIRKHGSHEDFFSAYDAPSLMLALEASDSDYKIPLNAPVWLNFEMILASLGPYAFASSDMQAYISPSEQAITLLTRRDEGTADALGSYAFVAFNNKVWATVRPPELFIARSVLTFEDSFDKLNDFPVISMIRELGLR